MQQYLIWLRKAWGWPLCLTEFAGGNLAQRARWSRRFIRLFSPSCAPTGLSAWRRKTCVRKFVPANPSSHVYLNGYRAPNGDENWDIPRQDCSSGDAYNTWKYGLDSLYGYSAARGAEWARYHLPQRKVELLAGTLDVTHAHRLDTDCGAEWQGPFRYQRAHIFSSFMDRFYSPNNFSVTDVPGVAHNSTKMFASPQGRSALFFAD